MSFLIIAENQPREIKSTKIRLVAQRREILAQVIKVEVVLRLLELNHLRFFMLNQVSEYVDISDSHYCVYYVVTETIGNQITYKLLSDLKKLFF